MRVVALCWAVATALILLANAQVNLPDDTHPNCPYPVITEQQGLKPENRKPKDFLGQYVKETKYNLFGGAYGNRNWAGLVQVYRRKPSGEYELFQTIKAKDRQDGAYFGLNLDSKGKYLTISAPFRRTFGNKSGALYVYKREDETGKWREFQKVVPDFGHPGMYFGYCSTIISKKQIVVGARRQNGPEGKENVGSFHVFRKVNGVFKTIQIVYGSGGQFGDELRSQGRLLLVGAPRELGKGAAYVYKRKISDNTYGFIQRLFPQIPDNVTNGLKVHLGEGISFGQKGKFILMGGETAFGPNGRTGAVYMFVSNDDGSFTYKFKQALYPTAKRVNQRFGQRLKMIDNMVIIGAWKDYNKGPNRGSVSLWHKCNDGTFRERHVIKLQKGYADDHFGKVVDGYEGHIIAGSPKRDASGKDDTSTDEGQIYTWKFEIVCPNGCPPA